ncbi:hypothetical protein [Kangiella sp. TOML190]|uniref:hypothetical protein n=1 Tax=Kangiella sp. TOML190 TaxID=2931351 RepID=UPI002040B6D0|nr:hypothetical protein [Kangiella sp. TOML190]
MGKLRLHIYVALLALASVLAFTQALDKYGYQYTDEALKRSLVAFGIARGLNGLISVAQEAEIAMQPAGVGLTLSPGEILDPVNDLIERFSNIMLISASALGVQKLLLSISAWHYFNYLAIVFWLAIAIFLVLNRHHNPKLQSRLITIGLFLVLVRFITPVMALSSQGLYQIFLKQDYIEASQGLEHLSQDLEAESETTHSEANADASVLEKAQAWFSDTVSEFDIQKQIESYKQAAESASQDVIKLITLFVVQTLIFPLLFLWLLIALGKKGLSSISSNRPTL